MPIVKLPRFIGFSFLFSPFSPLPTSLHFTSLPLLLSKNFASQLEFHRGSRPEVSVWARLLHCVGYRPLDLEADCLSVVPEKEDRKCDDKSS